MMIDLTNCEIVFTGRLTTMTRQQAITLAQTLGAVPKNWLTVKTAYVVVGVVPATLGHVGVTHKLASAVPTLTEAEFLTWASWVLMKWSRNLSG
ncbi:BRCT domain-containing protein [Secundilactobacillus collinoides]|nr:BRCT domain-containing protein [Secundilactobacillus collinoides]